jgi:hypothetical protein
MTNNSALDVLSMTMMRRNVGLQKVIYLKNGTSTIPIVVGKHFWITKER